MATKVKGERGRGGATGEFPRTQKNGNLSEWKSVRKGEKGSSRKSRPEKNHGSFFGREEAGVLLPDAGGKEKKGGRSGNARANF